MENNREKILLFIEKIYEKEPLLKEILIEHSKAVADKAIKFGKNLKLSKSKLNFIEEAALLHDIGIIGTDIESLNSKGDKPYLLHGVIGSKILKENGFSQYALVCERHIGFGLSKEEIIEKKLPIPKRDFFPITIEEKIVSLADKFFSKKKRPLDKEKSVEEIKGYALRHGKNQLFRFNALMKEIVKNG